jgi:hypothetical protein
MHVLFIGNSLTAYNGLPGLVEAVASAGGKVSVETAAVTINNFSLEDHWNSGPARQAIAARRWDVVVLQQGPSALPESQASLREYVKRFDAAIKRARARTALYMVWPSKTRFSDMNGVVASHANAAASVGAMLLPAGLAWQMALEREPELPLYGADQFHPSELGSYLAALVIYEGLTGHTTGGQRPAMHHRTLTPGRLHLLSEVAHQSLTVQPR